jgi:hypothetical protein
MLIAVGIGRNSVILIIFLLAPFERYFEPRDISVIIDINSGANG